MGRVARCPVKQVKEERDDSALVYKTLLNYIVCALVYCLLSMPYRTARLEADTLRTLPCQTPVPPLALRVALAGRSMVVVVEDVEDGLRVLPIVEEVDVIRRRGGRADAACAR